MLKKTLDIKTETPSAARNAVTMLTERVAGGVSAPLHREVRKSVGGTSYAKQSHVEESLSSLGKTQTFSALRHSNDDGTVQFRDKHDTAFHAAPVRRQNASHREAYSARYAQKGFSTLSQEQDIAAEVRAAKTKAAAMLAAKSLVKSEPVSAQVPYEGSQRHAAETVMQARAVSAQAMPTPVPDRAQSGVQSSVQSNVLAGAKPDTNVAPSAPPADRKKTERGSGAYSAQEKIKFLADVQKAGSVLQSVAEESVAQTKNSTTTQKNNEKELVTPSKNDVKGDSEATVAQANARGARRNDATHFSQESANNTMSSVPVENKKREYTPKSENADAKAGAAVKKFAPPSSVADFAAAKVSSTEPSGANTSGAGVSSAGSPKPAPHDTASKSPSGTQKAAQQVAMPTQSAAKQTPLVDAPASPTGQGKVSPMPASSVHGAEAAREMLTAQKRTDQKRTNTGTVDKAADSSTGKASAQPVSKPQSESKPTQVATERENGAGKAQGGGVPVASQPQADSIPDVPPMPVAPSEVDFIPPLLRSLSSLLRLRGKSISPQFLYAGLAGVGEVTPGECMRAAGRAGLQARIIHRPLLEDISPMTLPCILLLQGNRSCLLTALSHNVATVIFPEMGEDPQQVSQESILKEYTGYAVFGSVEKQADKRIDTFRRPQGKRWFWDAIKHYGPIYRHAAFASVIINLIALGSPLFVMNVYDRVVPNNAIDTLWVLALGVTIAYFFDFLLRTLRNHFVDTAGRNADVVISSMLVDKVLSMQLDHKPESTGALVNNVREFESLREFFSSSTLLSCIDLPFLFLFILCLSFIGGPLVILPLVAMPIMFGAGLILQALAKRAAEKSYSQNMHKNALLTEIVNGLETLKCCQGENRMQRMWEGVVENSAQANIETKKYGSLAVGFSVFITQFVTVGMVVWGVHLIAAGELTMGGLIGSNILAGRAMAPLMQMAGLITRYQNSRISLDALNMLMALPSEDRQEQATVDFGPLEASFIFENVAFSYPGVARTAVEGLSLKINHGEKIGVIGRMGSGKSTLIRLLIGLYQPKEGAVKFGGVDLRQLAGADLRSRVGFAPQDTVLFYGTVRDNIVLGDPYINDQRMIRAASLAGVTDFIRTNPEGFGAQVGEQGRALSGGQRQAIGLARSLVRDPEVLILDEPTSNMDTSSEQAVQARLHKIIKDKTLILVTHRMSMLRLVDRLIVMDGGRIVADGPKDAVIQKLRASSPTASKKKGDEIAV